MKPPALDYIRPSSLAEALRLTTEAGESGKVLAGGQSLIPMLNLRIARPSLLIDLNSLTELAKIEERGADLVVGSMARQRDVERSPIAMIKTPLLVKAIHHIGHVQIRNRGTIGGSLAHSHPAAEIPAVTAALGATFVVASAHHQRELSAAEFHTGYMSSAMQADEVLTEIRIPTATWDAGTAFEEISRRAGDFALCGAGAQIRLDPGGRLVEARLGLTGVGLVPIVPDLSDLVGERGDKGLVHEIARRAQSACDPQSDLHASAEFRRHLAGLLTRRVIAAACTEAAHRLAIGPPIRRNMERDGE